MAFVRENRLQFSSLRAAGLNPAQTPYGKQPDESRLRLIQKKREAATLTRHGLVFGVNFTEISGIQAQGKHNKHPPTAKRTAHRGEAIWTQKGGARLDSYAQGPSGWVRDVRGSGAWPGGVDWRCGLGPGCEDLGRGLGRGLEAWTGGVALGRCLGERTWGVA